MWKPKNGESRNSKKKNYRIFTKTKSIQSNTNVIMHMGDRNSQIVLIKILCKFETLNWSLNTSQSNKQRKNKSQQR